MEFTNSDLALFIISQLLSCIIGVLLGFGIYEIYKILKNR